MWNLVRYIIFKPTILMDCTQAFVFIPVNQAQLSLRYGAQVALEPKCAVVDLVLLVTQVHTVEKQSLSHAADISQDHQA
jgi:hypothetical protein